MAITGPTTTTTVGGHNGPVLPPYYADFMRANLYPNMYFRQLGHPVTVPPGYSREHIKIPRWDTPVYHSKGQALLTGSLTAIVQVTEGNVITPMGLGAQFISGSVVQFAGGRSYTDTLIITARANFYEGALESLTRELSWRIDNKTRADLDSASVAWAISAGSQSAGARTSDGLFGKNVAKIAPYLDSMSVPRWEDNTYVMVANPLVQYDIFRDPSASGFVPVARYNDPEMIYRGELGQKFSIRFLLSNTVPVIRGATAGNVGAGKLSSGGDVSGSFGYVFAPDAFYTLELEKGGVEVIHHPLGSGGATGDPANQRGSISVKVYYGIIPAPASDRRLMRFAHGISLRF